jgi:hypothetical protein
MTVESGPVRHAPWTGTIVGLVSSVKATLAAQAAGAAVMG